MFQPTSAHSRPSDSRASVGMHRCLPCVLQSSNYAKEWDFQYYTTRTKDTSRELHIFRMWTKLLLLCCWWLLEHCMPFCCQFLWVQFLPISARSLQGTFVSHIHTMHLPYTNMMCSFYILSHYVMGLLYVNKAIPSIEAWG